MAAMASCKCSKEKVFKFVILTLVLLIVVQLLVSSQFYRHYQSLIVYMSPVADKIRNISQRNTSAEIKGIRNFVSNNRSRSPQRLPLEKVDLVTNEVVSGTFKAGNNSQRMEACPLIPPNLKETVPVIKDILSYDEISSMFPNLLRGGRWKPPNCVSRHRVAIIIPYRNREAHLKVFVRHMHSFLQHQQLDYGIYVVELAEPTKFNRAMLMNIGFVEALKLYDYQCFVFHDVDLLPEDERNMYSCPEQPRHMSAAIDTLKYRLPYAGIFGGVSALTKEQFQKVNGFSNKFFGWGGEDDDMHNRIVSKNYKIIRYPINIARYKMLSHKKDKPSPERFGLLYHGKQRFDKDGLNSLLYTLKEVKFNALFTWIYVDINEKEVKKAIDIIVKTDVDITAPS